MIIDFYTHIYPDRYFQELGTVMERLGGKGRPVRSVAKLHDLDLRFREMDTYDNYRQVISLPNPPLDDIPDVKAATYLASVGNDTMAELSEKHKDRFPAWTAAVCLRDTDAAIEEVDRAINQLGASGVQVFTQVGGRPLDDPQFDPFFAAMEKHDLPVLLHPARLATMTDFSAEAKSRYEMWICFGWPYETSVTMSRFVFGGLFDRYPNIKLLTHHLGGMIPFFEGRIGPGMDVLGVRTPDEDYSGILPALKKKHMDYFHMFYADTALFSGGYGYECGVKFFGADKVLFASDSPYARTGETIDSVARLPISVPDLQKIMVGNAEKLIRKKLT